MVKSGNIVCNDLHVHNLSRLSQSYNVSPGVVLRYLHHLRNGIFTKGINVPKTVFNKKRNSLLISVQCSPTEWSFWSLMANNLRKQLNLSAATLEYDVLSFYTSRKYKLFVVGYSHIVYISVNKAKRKNMHIKHTSTPGCIPPGRQSESSPCAIHPLDGDNWWLLILPIQEQLL